jgi:hypothetical protein
MHELRKCCEMVNDLAYLVGIGIRFLWRARRAGAFDKLEGYTFGNDMGLVQCATGGTPWTMDIASCIGCHCPSGHFYRSRVASRIRTF